MFASRVVAHRCFFALVPPPDVASAIGAVRNQHGELTRIVTNDRLHMTLAITNDHAVLSDELLAALVELAPTFGVKPFEMVLDRVAARSLRPSHIPPELRDLSRQMVAGIRHGGALRPNWSFNPHVTLGYGDGASENRKIGGIRWRCTDFLLIHSEVGATVHNLVGRWPLDPRQGAFDF